MKRESKRSGHWTEDELVAYLYGVGPGDGHINDCLDCQSQARQMGASREAVRQLTPDDVSTEFLAHQRRQIYARVSEPVRWNVRRWASAAAAVLVVGGGLAVYEQQHVQLTHSADSKITDAQLVDDVSAMAQNPEPDSAAPLQSLFVE